MRNQRSSQELEEQNALSPHVQTHGHRPTVPRNSLPVVDPRLHLDLRFVSAASRADKGGVFMVIARDY